MPSEPDAWVQFLLGGKGAFKIVYNIGVSFVANKRLHHAGDVHKQHGFACACDLIAGGTLGMAGMEEHCDFGIAELDGFSILENFINPDGSELVGGGITESVDFAATFQRGFIAGGCVHFRARGFLHFRHCGYVIVVGLHGEKDFNVLHLEAELFDALVDERQGIDKPGID